LLTNQSIINKSMRYGVDLSIGQVIVKGGIP
jgi:hypothetical protein